MKYEDLAFAAMSIFENFCFIVLVYVFGDFIVPVLRTWSKFIFIKSDSRQCKKKT